MSRAQVLVAATLVHNPIHTPLGQSSSLLCGTMAAQPYDVDQSFTATLGTIATYWWIADLGLCLTLVCHFLSSCPATAGTASESGFAGQSTLRVQILFGAQRRRRMLRSPLCMINRSKLCVRANEYSNTCLGRMPRDAKSQRGPVIRTRIVT